MFGRGKQKEESKLVRGFWTLHPDGKSDFYEGSADSLEQLARTGVLKKDSRRRIWLIESIFAKARESYSAWQETVLVALRSVQFKMAKEIEEATIDDQLGLLPPGVKHYWHQGYVRLFVIEEPPAVRRILFSSSFAEDHVACSNSGEAAEAEEGDESQTRIRFNLAFPYVVITLLFKGTAVQDLWVHFRPAPLSSLKDPLFRAALPNSYQEDPVCLGNEIAAREQFVTYGQRIAQYLDDFWRGEFNEDVTNGFDDAADGESRFAKLDRWAEASKEDPLFPLRADLVVAEDLANLVERLKTRDESCLVANLVEGYCESIEESVRGLESVDLYAPVEVASGSNPSPKSLYDKIIERLFRREG